MFNVAVLRLKDIIKYLVCIFLIILVIFLCSEFFSNKDENKNVVTEEVENITNEMSENSLLECIDATIPVVASINNAEENTDQDSDDNIFEAILETQISSIKVIKNMSESEVSNNDENVETVEENNQEVQLASDNVNTEVITENPITESYNIQYGNVKIKNETSYTLTEEMLTPDISIDNKNIIIFHTHTCESYTPTEQYQYVASGNYRTVDLNFSVARVGTELQNQLTAYGYNVVHDTTYHDYPAYNGSYTRSLATVENLLQTTSADIIIDLHRDAIGSNSSYAPTVKIGDEEAAQIMFVIGTNDGGLWHPNWNQNLKFAILVQEKAEELYPGLFKPIKLTTSRYNQHTGLYANIIEVGATGNTLEQCLTSMKFLAKVLSEVLN